jgi:thymidylate kinase
VTVAAGKVLMIAGPDGVGKSTLAESMVSEGLGGLEILQVHHRQAGVLPARKMRGSGTEPHRHPPYSPLVSLAKLLYLFVDFRLAWALRIEPFRRRGGWVLLQRYWWDAAIDPRRYRLRSSPRLFRWLGRLLPDPDLIMVLEASPAEIMQRKQELSQKELARQTRDWRRLLSGRPNVTFLDASLPPDELARRALEELSQLDRRRDEPQWINLPRRNNPRWTVRRDPPSRTAAGLSIYQPSRLRGLAGWNLSRLLAALGLFRMFPRGQPPPAALDDILASHVPDGRIVAVARSSHPDRLVALVEGPGSDRHIAKVAFSKSARRALVREAENIRTLGRLLPQSVKAPAIQAEGPGLLLLEAVRARPRVRPWRVPPEVAFALGRLFRAQGTARKDLRGPAHADFAPWNLIRTSEGWTLVDWEHARADALPLYDVWHWLFQSHDLLGWPTRQTLLDGFRGRGWVGQAIDAYRQGAGLDLVDASSLFLEYLDERTGPDEAATRRDLQGAVRGMGGR